MLLADPAYIVPPPGPPGPVGSMAWLRATVSRFSAGEVHARRRARVESVLADLDPAELRAAARASVELHNEELCNSTLAYVPVAVLAEALGVPRGHEIVADVRVVAAASPGEALATGVLEGAR